MTHSTVLSDYDKSVMAFNVLRDLGMTHFKPECQKEVDPYDAAGIALSQISRPRDIAALAYGAWEDSNAHDWCAWLNFVSHLYPRTHIDTLKTLVKMADRDVMVYYYDDEAQEWKQKTYHATLTFEEVTE